MKTIAIIKHLYLEIPHFLDENNKVINKNCHLTFLNNIKQELQQATNQYQFNLKTIYISNKSITILPITFLEQLLKLLIIFSTNIIEYNFEGNFSNINFETLQLLKQYHLNRLIWKLITFDKPLNKNTALITKAINLGFINFSIDLKYNLPKQNWKQIVNDLQICIQLQTPNISYDSYNQSQNPKLKSKINNFLKNNNYEHYEYYSYALFTKNQGQAIIAYCLLENYYGLGPNAVSYIANSTNDTLITNTTHNNDYQKQISHLSQNEVFIYRLIQGLLLKKGITLSDNDKKAINFHQTLLNKLIKNGHIIIKNKQLFCTNKGWRLLNELIIDIIK